MTTLIIIIEAIAAIILAYIAYHKNAKMKLQTIELDSTNNRLGCSEKKVYSLTNELNAETKKLNTAKTELADFKRITEEEKDGFNETINTLNRDKKSISTAHDQLLLDKDALENEKEELLRVNGELNTKIANLEYDNKKLRTIIDRIEQEMKPDCSACNTEEKNPKPYKNKRDRSKNKN
jgi:chromosome segregation ATPase